MDRFKLVNRITGWAVFLVAAVVYLLTIEPTVSFWDCGEFIASGVKLQVGHPPGAPTFMLLTRLASLFASNSAEVAKMTNSMSALASAFTVLFLYWSITHLAKKIYNVEENSGNLWAVVGSGVVGALAFTFSDTFWFSAVESEVYALSSMVTAFVFYAILKWENVADEKYSTRWIILIAFLMGLSIGIHLLNLLAIPAIVFVIYFRKYQVTRNGVIGAFLISIIILGAFMYLLIPGVVKIASGFELLFVNGLGLPYHSGVLFFVAAVGALLAWGIYRTHKKRKVILNTILLSLTVVLIGYSSYSTILIRSAADPPLDENDPETVFSLYHYLKREQYGSSPLLFGQYYNAPVVDSENPHTYRKEKGKYVKTYSLNPDYEFDSRFTTFFPRMWSRQQKHVREYKKWADIEGKPVTVQGRGGKQQTKKVPTFGENLKFFFKYQVGHMYLRYFMWNFAGRQNDIQGHGELNKGNWLSGIDFIDEARLGKQENLPAYLKNNKARNTYYMLPLLLGLIGFFFHYKKKPKDFTVTLLLFLFTGLAIVVYLNQYPLQPRERDYAYAGSFYAFAIWIGLGSLALFDWLQKKAPKLISAIIATLIPLVLVPGIMASENWDDHDRSDRYAAHDFAYNYLNSCAPNAILFTHGDNDTFPLWYAQEVEGIRTDVRVVNLSLLNTDWYITQMKRKAYESEPVPFSLKEHQYRQGKRDQIPIVKRYNKYVSAKQLVDFVGSDNPQTQLPTQGNTKINYAPTNKFTVAVDSAKVVNNGTVSKENADEIVSKLKWKINQNNLAKSELMILDLLANNDWERPIYFVSPSEDANLGLSDYLQLEGFAYRLVPIKTKAKNRIDAGRVDTDIMYENLMEKFKWGNINDPDVYVDYTTRRTSRVIRIRNKFARLADKLNKEGKREKAVEVLDRGMELTPNEQIPYKFSILEMIQEYYDANAREKARKLVKEVATLSEEKLNYYFSLDQKFEQSVNRDKQIALSIIQRLSQITAQHGHNKLSKELKNTLNNSLSQMRQ
jgi:hypothetical protein